MQMRFTNACVMCTVLSFTLLGCTGGESPSKGEPVGTQTTSSPDKTDPASSDPEKQEPEATGQTDPKETDPTVVANAPTTEPSESVPETVSELPSNVVDYTPNPAITRAGVKPAKKDSLLLYYGDDPDTLNLLTSSDTTSRGFQLQVYEGLASQTYPDPDKWEPTLAESWTFDKEKLSYTINLRKGVYWHPMSLPNGKKLPKTEFTAADVKFTFDCLYNESIEAGPLRSYYIDPEETDSRKKYMMKLSVLGKHKIKMTWSKPYFLMDTWTLGIAILPKHVYGVNADGEPVSLDYRNSKEFAKLFNEHWANTTMCGTGPMIFKTWDREKQVVLERNEEYWGEPFYFSDIIYQNISNPNTAAQKVLQNELDWAGFPQKDKWVQSKEEATVVSGKVNLVDYDYPGYRYIGYNLKHPLLGDKNVRWALSHAMPVEDIIEKIYFKLASRLTGPFLPGSSASDDSIPFIKYDLARAKELLDEAGWKDTDKDGLRDKIVDGKKVDAVFELLIFSESPQFRQIAELFREDGRKIGIDIKLTPTKWALMLEKLDKKNFDAVMLGWGLSWDSDPFQLWHGSQAEKPDNSNFVGYKNPDVDKLIDKLRVTLDKKEQQKIYHQIHKHIYDDQPYTFLFMEKATAGHHSRLENIKTYQIRPCYDLREWTASKARVIGK